MHTHIQGHTHTYTHTKRKTQTNTTDTQTNTTHKTPTHDHIDGRNFGRRRGGAEFYERLPIGRQFVDVVGVSVTFSDGGFGNGLLHS